MVVVVVFRLFLFLVSDFEQAEIFSVNVSTVKLPKRLEFRAKWRKYQCYFFYVKLAKAKQTPIYHFVNYHSILRLFYFAERFDQEFILIFFFG